MAKKAKTIDPETYNKLVELCVDIEAHSDLDMEVTLGGNGTNCCEAMNVASEIIDIINPDKKTYQGLVKARKAELEKEYGFNDEDSEDEED